MRYKVGDKVVIRTDLVERAEYDGCYFSSDMKEFRGKIQTIKKISQDRWYGLVEDNEDWSFTDKMIDHEATAKLNEVKPIDLLENGMTVELRDGTRHLVLTNVEYSDRVIKFALVGNDTFRSVSIEYRDDLTSIMFTLSDIMAIYKPLVSSLVSMLGDNSNLIWERPVPPPEPKVIKMTLTEVATKLGLDENTKLEIEM